MAGKKHIEALEDTLAPVVTVADIMNKYGCSKGKALQIIKHHDLHAYLLGEEYFCERQYWDSFIYDLCFGGGTVTMK